MLSSTSTGESGHNYCEFNDDKTLSKVKSEKAIKG